MTLWRIAVALWCVTAGAGSLEFRTHELPWAIVNAPYEVEIRTAADGRCTAADIGLAIAKGRLPRGLELAGTSIIGIPKELGSFHVRLRAQNGCETAHYEYSIFVTGKPALRVTPEKLVIEVTAGEAPPRPETMLVSSTWPELAYSAMTSGAGWLSLRLLAGKTPPPGSSLAGDIVQGAILSTKLSPGTYHAEVTFSTWHGANTATVPITLIVRDKK